MGKGNPHPHKYAEGKQTTTMDFDTFQKTMESIQFTNELRDKSFLAFLYWFGVRKSEAYERVPSDFKIENNMLVVNCPAKKGGIREILKAPLNLPYMDLILRKVASTPEEQRVWRLSSVSAWRIVKKAFPKLYPHYFRLNRAVHFLDDPTTTIPEMQSWFGWRATKTIDSYLGYSERHLDKQATRLSKEISGREAEQD